MHCFQLSCCFTRGTGIICAQLSTYLETRGTSCFLYKAAFLCLIFQQNDSSVDPWSDTWSKSWQFNFLLTTTSPSPLLLSANESSSQNQWNKLPTLERAKRSALQRRWSMEELASEKQHNESQCHIAMRLKLLSFANHICQSCSSLSLHLTNGAIYF